MDAQAVLTVSAAVVALTQLVKRANVPERWQLLIVLALSALGVAVWAYTQASVVRADTFSYFVGWIAVATSATGVFGLTRAAAGRVAQMAPPSDSAGSRRATT